MTGFWPRAIVNPTTRSFKLRLLTFQSQDSGFNGDCGTTGPYSDPTLIFVLVVSMTKHFKRR